MLRWPKRALGALAYLFRPLQDIDVFVEDSRDEVFYNELFSRIAPTSVRVSRIFPLGSRSEVVAAAGRHDFKLRPALFLIDGDFEWVRDEQPPDVPGLHRLEAYCVENLLMHEGAAVQLIIEEAAIPEGQAKLRFDYAGWIADISGALVQLFTWFAILNSVDPKEPTTGLGVGKVITSPKKKVLPTLDLAKVEALRRNIEAKAIHTAGTLHVNKLHAKLSARITGLPRTVDVISGKDFLLPLFEFRLWGCIPNKTQRRSLRVRLARHCNPKLFVGVTSALEERVRT